MDKLVDFKLIFICLVRQGIYARYLLGNASAPNAAEFHQCVEPLAKAALQIAGRRSVQLGQLSTGSSPIRRLISNSYLVSVYFPGVIIVCLIELELDGNPSAMYYHTT